MSRRSRRRETHHFGPLCARSAQSALAILRHPSDRTPLVVGFQVLTSGLQWGVEVDGLRGRFPGSGFDSVSSTFSAGFLIGSTPITPHDALRLRAHARGLCWVKGNRTRYVRASSATFPGFLWNVSWVPLLGRTFHYRSLLTIPSVPAASAFGAREGTPTRKPNDQSPTRQILTTIGPTTRPCSTSVCLQHTLPKMALATHYRPDDHAVEQIRSDIVSSPHHDLWHLSHNTGHNLIEPRRNYLKRSLLLRVIKTVSRTPRQHQLSPICPRVFAITCALIPLHLPGPLCRVLERNNNHPARTLQ